MSLYQMAYLSSLKEDWIANGVFSLEHYSTQNAENSGFQFWYGTNKRAYQWKCMIAYSHALRQLAQGNEVIVFNNGKPIGFYTRLTRYGKEKYISFNNKDSKIEHYLLSVKQAVKQFMTKRK